MYVGYGPLLLMLLMMIDAASAAAFSLIMYKRYVMLLAPHGNVVM